MSPVQDGPECSGCGLPNYSGLCPVCSGDEQAAHDEGMPYPWPDDQPECVRDGSHSDDLSHEAEVRNRTGRHADPAR